MGKPAANPDHADRHRSWTQYLPWTNTEKQSSPTLPTVEPERANRNPGDVSFKLPSSQADHDANHNHIAGDDRIESAVRHNVPTATLPFAPTLVNTEAQGEKSTSINGANEETRQPKPPIPERIKAGSKRFARHTKNAIFHSWINLLLVFVPLGIAVKAAGLSPSIVFAMNAIAVVPLAGLLAHATESVASRLGDTLGALLNVSFGNAVELIIFIALVKNEIRIVQASLLGSILANLLLILGMAFVAGGLRYQEQIYNNTVTQMSAVMLSLSVMSLLLPTAFHASFDQIGEADNKTLEVSRGTSVVLLLVYILYLLFQLKSHAYLYTSMPQHMIDEEAQPGILADVFDTSSSSSSSSSSSDTDTTSGSHTTAKKIKRFIRKRRKSSAGSDSPSGPSQMSSPNSDQMAVPGYFEDIPRGSRRPSIGLPDILSGDEGDDENLPRTMQDVGHRAGSVSHSSEGKHVKKARKSRKHRSKKHRHHRAVEIEEPQPEFEKVAVEPVADIPPFMGANRAPGIHHDVEESRTGTADSRRTGIKVFSRPTLPKLLSQNVFVDTPPPPPAPVNLVKTRSGPALRRTSSLPDRLHARERAHSTPGNRQLPVGRETIGSTLPPYANRGAWAARARLDTYVSATDPEEPEAANMSRTAAVVMLLITTALVAVCAEFLVDAIPEMTEHSAVSQAFIGLIILPIVGNAAEHVTAVTVAAKNKMDLAIGIAVGSSIQIALFITPVVVILGWCMNKDMSLYFNLFETVSLFVTVFVVNFLVLDGKSNYLEGVLLIAAYIIIAVAAFFYPPPTEASELGGKDTENEKRMVMLLARSAYNTFAS